MLHLFPFPISLLAAFLRFQTPIHILLIQTASSQLQTAFDSATIAPLYEVSASMVKDELEHSNEKKAEEKKSIEKKTDEPWTDKERNVILNHVLNHVLKTVGYGTVFSELSGLLVKEGFPARGSKAYQDQWRRKICKDVMAIYGGVPPTSPATPTKAVATSRVKPEGSPSKRKRETKEE
ncbi:hypothetical protein PHSY_006811 [Pseudozyma hubeiensis SY62]|uniref:Uncharacterized protein n=1 Tax=Pseudozyma hubeiensis (strain SY62) TaxID=1305764 RepID=R9PCX4_PSEHS|nr:hypothetical protein PHSY_006811 [Pseudozyma hubeiensis SY62]GAC99211.1 hypothetical protein PHSY_006811 [Pseudozyma hubeiensis SY62]